jgi:hypothetical protein
LLCQPHIRTVSTAYCGIVLPLLFSCFGVFWVGFVEPAC